MKKKELVSNEFLQAFDELYKQPVPVYTAKNIEVVKSHIVQNLQEIEKFRLDSCIQLAVKDEKGEPAVKDNNYVVEDLDQLSKLLEGYLEGDVALPKVLSTRDLGDSCKLSTEVLFKMKELFTDV